MDEDGSCIFATIITPGTIVGCTYPKATNFNPRAMSDDGSCRFYPVLSPTIGGTTGGGTGGPTAGPTAGTGGPTGGVLGRRPPAAAPPACTNGGTNRRQPTGGVTGGTTGGTIPPRRALWHPRAAWRAAPRTATNYNPKAVNDARGSCQFTCSGLGCRS